MKLVPDVYVSEFSQKTLSQFGWAAGDAIPEELGQILIDMREGLPPSKKTDVLIDVDVMSEEQVAKVKDLLAQAKELGIKRQKEKELDEVTKNMAPEVSEAYRKLHAAEENAGPQIIDDMDTPAKDSAEQPAQPAAAAEAEPAPAEDTTQAEEPEKEAADAPAVKTPQDISFCPRCGWNLNQKFEIIPTRRDKEDFLATLLGGARFKKKYELFGGKFIVTFRSMYAEENKLLYRQLVLDQKTNLVATEAEWFTQMMDYRLACSLETIATSEGKVISAIPELEEFTPTANLTEPLSTPLPAQLQLINKTLAQETTRRIVGLHLRQFQRLVEALEAMALEPDFWNGIE